MDIAATLNGESVRIVEMMPSQVVGSYYILYVTSSNRLYMTEKTRDEFDESLATNATITDVATAESVEELDYENHHTSYVFPTNTQLNCVLTAGLANTWSGYTSIIDSGANNFDTIAAASSIHISGLVVEAVSANDNVYMLEVSYGPSHTRISVVRILGGNVPKQDTKVRAMDIPMGSNVYYRCMCETGGATLNLHIRWHVCM